MVLIIHKYNLEITYFKKTMLYIDDYHLFYFKDLFLIFAF